MYIYIYIAGIFRYNGTIYWSTVYGCLNVYWMDKLREILCETRQSVLIVLPIALGYYR